MREASRPTRAPSRPSAHGVTAPGTLIAAGREAEIFDLGDGRVLRRYRREGSPEREALVMAHARGHGFPAPRVFGADERGLVLERIDGRSMLEDLRRRPWLLRRHAATLARLHLSLHRIDAPPELPAVGPGRALLHLDLHPENILLSKRGLIVIDWTNARRGDGALDVALTWVIMATSEVDDPVARMFRAAYVRAFLSHFSRAEITRAAPAAAERRLADPNVRQGERLAVRRLLDTLRGPSG